MSPFLSNCFRYKIKFRNIQKNADIRNIQKYADIRNIQKYLRLCCLHYFNLFIGLTETN